MNHTMLKLEIEHLRVESFATLPALEWSVVAVGGFADDDDCTGGVSCATCPTGCDETYCRDTCDWIICGGP